MIRIKLNQELLDKHIDNILKVMKLQLDSRNSTNDNKCLEYLKDNLEDILKANPTQLKEYIKYFKKKFPKAIKDNRRKLVNQHQLYNIVKHIFDDIYKSWSKNHAYYFVKGLGLQSCPYCNRNYTFVVEEESGKLRPEIDHFHPKSKYPFLALSFYNLIPSCSVCNHTKSSKIDDDLINPYDIEPNDFSFTYIPNSADFISNVKDEKYNFDNFDIKLNGNQANLDIFHLEELYKQHKDIVLELLIKKAYYPQSYVEELSNFGFSQDEIYRYLLCNYVQDEDLHKRPLSKLIKDISSELKLI